MMMPYVKMNNDSDPVADAYKEFKDVMNEMKNWTAS